MRPTLLILAAGMGSRYGGLKQIDGIGPNQEPIIEYSIYDAIRSGFGKIVFVIRKEFDKAFRSRFDKFSDKILLDKNNFCNRFQLFILFLMPICT